MHLVRLIISRSKFHLAIFFTSLSWIWFIPFWISISYVFLSLYSNALPHHSRSSFVPSILILTIWYSLLSSKLDSIFSCAPFSALTFRFSCRRISSTALLTIALLYWFLLKKSWYSFVPAFLCRPISSILITKVSEGLAFVWWMPGAMYETCGFCTYPSGGLHIVFYACQRSCSSSSNYLMRQILLSFACCVQHGWYMTLQFFYQKFLPHLSKYTPQFPCVQTY